MKTWNEFLFSLTRKAFGVCDNYEDVKSFFGGIAAHSDSFGTPLSHDGFNSFCEPERSDTFAPRFEDVVDFEILAPYLRESGIFSESLGLDIQFHFVGADYEEDEVWGVRVWDNKNNCQLSPRVYAQNIEDAMTEIWRFIRDPEKFYDDEGFSERCN